MKALWMPPGSVRAILAIIVVAGVFALVGYAVWAEKEAAQALVGAVCTLAGAVGTFYFLRKRPEENT